MKLMDIAEVTDRTGIPPSTLRYYDEIGLIRSASRHGLRRQFEPDVLLQLALISMGKTAGFSLDAISGIFGKNRAPELPRDKLHNRANALDQQIHELIALRDTLRHVADCSAPSHLECPRFHRLLRVAVKRGQKRK